MKAKELIKEKTWCLLLEKGYDGVSVSDICKATEMARGLLYHYFRNKEDLFDEIVQDVFIRYYQLDRDVLKANAIGEMIVFASRFLTDIFQGLPAGAGRQLTVADGFLLLYQAAEHDEAFARQLKKNKVAWFAGWKTALLNSFAKGELRSGLNMESVARHFVYIVQGGIIATTKEGQDTVYEIEKGLWEFFEIIKR